MTAPATRCILAAFSASGAPIRFVGGCVRDGLLGRPVGDLDLCTPLTPDRMIAILEQAGIKCIPTGIDHGTITAVTDHQPFEITTLRHDVETDGRRAKVAFTDDWQADAARRDLTMNALSADADGRVYDYFGGLDDLATKRIRFVGDPHKRLVEDVLRLMRYYRFFAWYGAPPFDDAARDACRAMAHALPRLSAERVRVELLKLLKAPAPMTALIALRDDGGLAHWLPEATEFDKLSDLIAIGAPPDDVLRLAALLPDESAALIVARRLKLSNVERDRLLTLTRPIPQVSPDLDDAGLRDALYLLGHEALIGRLWLSAGQQSPAAALARIQAMERPIPPLAGRDLLALGLKPGPEFARILKSVELWWRTGGFKADRYACRAEAERLIAETATT